MPRQSDSVIGIVTDLGPSSWIVNINSPYPALLHINEVPWKVDFGDTANFISVGDVILTKITNVDEIKRVGLTLKEHGLRKLDGGELVKIPYIRVPGVIGRGGAMITLLKQSTDTRMFVGQNGYIWIDGEMESINLVREAIKIIEADILGGDLTGEIKELLAGSVPKTEVEQ